jgi:hypothetical protein
MALQYKTLPENAFIYNIRAFRCKIFFTNEALHAKWKLAQKFSNFLLNKISFDTTLNFNQVDLPYPVWNQLKTDFVVFSF